MVEAGADVNLKNNDSWAPLHSAIRKGNLETVDALLQVRSNNKSKYPLDLNIPGGPIDMTPLHIACCANYYRIVNSLIQAKVDLFAYNAEGKSPFTIINNNMLMLKLIKKAMIASVRDQFEDSSKMPRETHMVNINLLKKLAEKFIYGHKRRKFT